MDTTSVTKRELNQNTAGVLGGIGNDDVVIVTERGVPRWRIEAVAAGSDPITRLRAEGRIRPAKAEPAPWPTLDNPTGRTPADVDAALDEMRGDH